MTRELGLKWRICDIASRPFRFGQVAFDDDERRAVVLGEHDGLAAACRLRDHLDASHAFEETAQPRLKRVCSVARRDGASSSGTQPRRVKCER
jgi:hypothetical protein